jgi:hypothetical protein
MLPLYLMRSVFERASLYHVSVVYMRGAMRALGGFGRARGMIRKVGCGRGWRPRPRRLGFAIKV